MCERESLSPLLLATESANTPFRGVRWEALECEAVLFFLSGVRMIALVWVGERWRGCGEWWRVGFSCLGRRRATGGKGR